MTASLVIALFLSASTFGWSVAYIPITLRYNLSATMLSNSIIGAVLSGLTFVAAIVALKLWTKK